MVKRVALIVCLALVIVALVRVVLTPPQSTSWRLPEGDQIVMVVIDTLRADHLSTYGYSKETAPFLASLANDAVVFERTHAACSSTAPSMATVFTSLYPSHHGVITGMRATERLKKGGQAAIELNRIPATVPTLGEIVARQGFRTFGVADNLNIDAPIGFTRGFEKFFTFPYDGAPKVNETVLQERARIGERSFTYIHYMDPHEPYHNRQPWVDLNDPNPRRRAYDSEIRYTDEHLRVLFDTFGWRDSALVIVLADHGEEFGEHGGQGHGKTLYPEVIHVPFFVYHRSLSPRRIAEPVHHIDLLPTLAAMIGAPHEPWWEGRSLLPLVMGESPRGELQGRTFFSQLLRVEGHPRPGVEAAMRGPFWYLHHDDGREELYRVDTDRLAQNDLLKPPSDEHERQRQYLRAALDEFRARAPHHASESFEASMDEATVERLKTLGYL